MKTIKKLVLALAVLSSLAFFLSPTTLAASGSGPPSGNTTICDQGNLTSDQQTSCQNCTDTGKDPTNCLKNNVIVRRLNDIVDFLSAGVGIVVVATLIVGGIQYSMAGGSPEAVNKAKTRLTNGAIALGVYLLIFGFLQWIVPGGIFNS